jgi:hypothetical protein
MFALADFSPHCIIVVSIAVWSCLDACRGNAGEPREGDIVKPIVPLSERHSGYAGSPDEWIDFLSCWHLRAKYLHEKKLRLEPARPYTPVVKYDPRSTNDLQSRESFMKEIAKLEVSLRVRLPKSYKDFLLAYRPLRHTSQIVGPVAFDIGVYAPSQVDRYGKLEPELLAEEERFSIHASDSKYFRYGVEQDDVSVRTSYHREALVVGKYGDSRFEVIVLYPQVRTTDGEMEAALFYHSGEYRAPSFAELMRQLSVLETTNVDHLPPYPQSTLHGTCADKLRIVNVWWD